jgi:gliding motility-associated-like protein
LFIFESFMSRLLLFRIAIVFVCLLCHVAAGAQVCTGSLGDPVVNVTFGTGSNPGNPLQAASTSYSYTTTTCPNDGSYTVVNSTPGCFSSSWYNILQDHTPNDNSGYMMLVNASYNPGDFYVDTVKGLCSNTKYEFAAWIMNVQYPTQCGGNPIAPKLVFNIETTTGVVLGTYSTGNILSSGTPEWKQYGLFFTTPLNTSSVVIRLTNTAPGGCGNDLALDDITFRPCGPTVTSASSANQTNIDMCTGSVANVPLTATVGSGYIAPSLQWQLSRDNGISWTDIAGATSLSYLVNQTAIGIYKFRLSVAEGTNIGIANCRVASNPVTVTIHDLPVVTASSNTPVCENRVVNLAALGGTTYLWSGPAGFSAAVSAPSFIARNNSSGQYSVVVTDGFGCKNTATTNVVASPKPTAVVSATQRICEGDSVRLQASGGSGYLWSPALGLSAINIANPVAHPVDSTVYSVVVSSNSNCTDTAVIIVNVFKRPTANAGPDKILLKGQSVVLEGAVGGSGVNFSWTPVTYLNNPLLAQPIATPYNDMLYSLQVRSTANCGVASDEVFVKVYNDIYVPTAFSPNNDGLNDTWRIEALVAVPNAKLTVYNRFGSVIFETTGNSKEWDGTYKGQALPTGSYVYMIDLKNGRPIKKGTVIIVR